MNVLVIGGTGTTGHFIVSGLCQRRHNVTILHRGHEIPETPEGIEHIHTDPYNADAMATALEGRRFDVCIAMYGRLRLIAEITKDIVDHFISVGGQPAYQGYMNPELLEPAGLPVPTPEDAPLVNGPDQDEKGYRIVRTEHKVFEAHPRATHFRYPYVYGPYQFVPREWCIVRRILDQRPHIILPEAGLTLHSYGYSENLAHAVLLAVEKPGIAAGQIYNCADQETLTLRQVVDIIAKSMQHDWEVVTMPWELAVPARPLIGQLLPTHRVMDISKIRHELGYCDVVKPAEALARTARWLADHRPESGGFEEMVLQDPFDYQTEDRLIAAWRKALSTIPNIEFKQEPGYTMAYSGPGSRERMHKEFDE